MYRNLYENQEWEVWNFLFEFRGCMGSEALENCFGKSSTKYSTEIGTWKSHVNEREKFDSEYVMSVTSTSSVAIEEPYIY